MLLCYCCQNYIVIVVSIAAAVVLLLLLYSLFLEVVYDVSADFVTAACVTGIAAAAVVVVIVAFCK